MVGIPFNTTAGIDVIFGNENEFVEVECFLKSHGIGNKKVSGRAKYFVKCTCIIICILLCLCLFITFWKEWYGGVDSY